MYKLFFSFMYGKLKNVQLGIKKKTKITILLVWFFKNCYQKYVLKVEPFIFYNFSKIYVTNCFSNNSVKNIIW